ncbi:hypothetical protein CLU81_0618 [Flavobacterium sp. 9]|nr:hypothetical protein CLU81_0618 [Flavobacterium sp. 9]
MIGVIMKQGIKNAVLTLSFYILTPAEDLLDNHINYHFLNFKIYRHFIFFVVRILLNLKLLEVIFLF